MSGAEGNGTGTRPAGVDQRQATTTARGRTYHWKGEEFWSVTTLLKGLPAPQLERWRLTKVAEAGVMLRRQVDAILAGTRMERLTKRLSRPVVDEIRKALGLTADVVGPRGGIKEPGDDVYIVAEDPSRVAVAIELLRNAPWQQKGQKADIGTAVHAEIEAYIKGTSKPQPALLVARHVAQFREFLEVIRPRIVLAEANVYNRTEAYAGRLDILAYIGDVVEVAPDGTEVLVEPGALYVLDVKTGSGVYPEAAYQAAAYARAQFIGLPDGTEVTMPRVDGAAALHLSEDGWELVPLVIDDDVFRDFLYIRENFDILERRSKRVVGQPVRSLEALKFLAVGGAPTLELIPGQAPGIVVELHAEPDE